MSSARRSSLLAGVLACALAACSSSSHTARHEGELAPSAVELLFPAPKRALRLASAAHPSLGALLDAFSDATDSALIIDAATRARIDAIALDRNIEFAVGDVYSGVETLLVQHELALTVLSDHAPRILRVVPIGKDANLRHSAGQLRSSAPTIDGGELDAWANDHPAVPVQTVVVLANADAGTAANSMRTLATNGLTQQVLVMPGSGTLVLFGFAPWLRTAREHLLAIDAATATESESQAAPARRTQ